MNNNEKELVEQLNFYKDNYKSDTTEGFYRQLAVRAFLVIIRRLVKITNEIKKAK